MKLLIADTYEALSRQTADDLIQLLKDKDHPLLCTASGDSPAGLYRQINKKVQNKEIDISNWYFVGLDEWIGMNGNDEGSCRFYLDQQLFVPLRIQADKICFFDGKSKDPAQECDRIEHFIQQHGGIDVAIVGLGMNGHIGMNEPGTSPEVRSHITALDPVTQKVGQKYFKQPQQLTTGITLGLADIMEARYVFLIVSGQHKAEVVHKMLDGPISKELPASLLRSHPGLHVYLDKEAAAMIKTDTNAD
jgi:galactosamine-6-phosphate isomerase